MTLLSRSILCVALVVTTGCATISENMGIKSRRDILTYTGLGFLAGGLIGAISAGNADDKAAPAVIGAGIGGTLAAVASATLVKEDRTENPYFVDFLKDLHTKSKLKPGQTKSYDLIPKELPKEVREQLRMPAIRHGRTEWFELEGRIYAPTDWFEYQEGKLNVPRLRR